MTREDIESFDFEFLEDKSIGETHRYQITGLYNRITDGHDDTMWWNVYLKHYADRDVVFITGDISDGSTNEKFFEGVIKTPEELKMILTMLGIHRTISYRG